MSLEKAVVATGEGLGRGVGDLVGVGVGEGEGVMVAVLVAVAALGRSLEIRATGTVGRAVSVGASVGAGLGVGRATVGGGEGNPAAGLPPQPARMPETITNRSRAARLRGLRFPFVGRTDRIGSGMITPLMPIMLQKQHTFGHNRSHYTEKHGSCKLRPGRSSAGCGSTFWVSRMGGENRPRDRARSRGCTHKLGCACPAVVW